MRAKKSAKLTKCPVCGRPYSTTKALVMMKPAPPNCPVCKVVPCNWNTVLQAWTCPNCNRVVCPIDIRVMTSMADGRYKCPQCGYWAPPA